MEAKSKQSEVFHQIEQERLYQSQRWPITPVHTEVCTTHTVSYGPRQERFHQLGTWLSLIGDYLSEAANRHARTDMSDQQKKDHVLHIVRKVASLAVGCLEQHGCPPRSQVDFNKVAREARHRREAEEQKTLDAKAPDPKFAEAQACPIPSVLQNHEFAAAQERLKAREKEDAAKAELLKLKEEQRVKELRDKGKAEVTAGFAAARIGKRFDTLKALEASRALGHCTSGEMEHQLRDEYAKIDQEHDKQLAKALEEIDKAGTPECTCSDCQIRREFQRIMNMNMDFLQKL